MPAGHKSRLGGARWGASAVVSGCVVTWCSHVGVGVGVKWGNYTGVCLHRIWVWVSLSRGDTPLLRVSLDDPCSAAHADAPTRTVHYRSAPWAQPQPPSTLCTAQCAVHRVQCPCAPALCAHSPETWHALHPHTLSGMSLSRFCLRLAREMALCRVSAGCKICGVRVGRGKWCAGVFVAGVLYVLHVLYSV